MAEEAVLLDGGKEAKERIFLVLSACGFLLLSAAYLYLVSTDPEVKAKLLIFAFTAPIICWVLWFSIRKNASKLFISVSAAGLTLGGDAECEHLGKKAAKSSVPYFSGSRFFIPAGRVSKTAYGNYSRNCDFVSVETGDGYKFSYFFSSVDLDESVWREKAKAAGLLK